MVYRSRLAVVSSAAVSGLAVFVGAVLGLAVVCCGGLQTATGQTPAEPKPGVPMATLCEMRSLVAKQIHLIRAGKAEELQQYFTPRLREFITVELLKERAEQVAQARVEDLVAEIRQLEKKGRHIVVVRTAHGRLLTVFVWHKESWLADTLWFR